METNLVRTCPWPCIRIHLQHPRIHLVPGGVGERPLSREAVAKLLSAHCQPGGLDFQTTGCPRQMDQRQLEALTEPHFNTGNTGKNTTSTRGTSPRLKRYRIPLHFPHIHQLSRSLAQRTVLHLQEGQGVSAAHVHRDALRADFGAGARKQGAQGRGTPWWLSQRCIRK